MPDLRFQIEGLEVVPYAAVPILALKLRITNEPADELIQSLTLRCQVQIQPAQRRYNPAEQKKLHDLFGEPERWSRTVRPLLWMNTSLTVSSFIGSTLVDVQLPCTFDFNVAVTKYFHGLESGDIPVEVLFSGSIFYEEAGKGLQITQIPWDREAKYRLLVEIWKRMMDTYYPNTAWLCLQREAFERLYRYKLEHGIPTWERVFEKLLPEQTAPKRVAAIADEVKQ